MYVMWWFIVHKFTVHYLVYSNLKLLSLTTSYNVHYVSLVYSKLLSLTTSYIELLDFARFCSFCTFLSNQKLFCLCNYKNNCTLSMEVNVLTLNKYIIKLHNHLPPLQQWLNICPTLLPFLPGAFQL